MLPPELGLLEHLFPATMSTWEALISAAKWLYMLPARVHSRVGIYARGECCRSSCSTARCPSFRTSWGAPVPGSQDVVHMGWIQPLSKVQHGTANTKDEGNSSYNSISVSGVYRVFRFRFRFRFWRCLGFSFLLPLFVWET